jgi:hypothetical protein
MLTALRFPVLRLPRLLPSMGCDGLGACGWPTEMLAGAGGSTPTTAAGCSWRLGWLTDAGTWLGATTYSLTAEPPDTENELASVPRNRRSAGLGRPKFPSQKRHHVFNVRPRKVRREAPRPGKRLMEFLAIRLAIRIIRRNSRNLSTGTMMRAIQKVREP